MVGTRRALVFLLIGTCSLGEGRWPPQRSLSLSSGDKLLSETTLAVSHSLSIQVGAFGKKLCSQVPVLGVMEQLVKLLKERADGRPAPLSRNRVSQAR